MLWLVLDCSYLCHRTMHVFGPAAASLDNGILFGFLRDVVFLQKQFNPQGIVFAFDSRDSKRKAVDSAYKRRRKKTDLSEEEKLVWNDFYGQVRELRRDVLPALGFQNVLVQKGYEADDIVASVVLDSMPSYDTAIIVSSDQDLYQLLSSRVSIWNPHQKRMFTKDWFMQTWQLQPPNWAQVKAIAGCSGDDVEGIKGIGEKTAALWVRGVLKPQSAAYKKISDQIAVLTKNLPLVSLPFEGCRTFDLQADSISSKTWDQTVVSLGMESLVGQGTAFFRRARNIMKRKNSR